MDQHTPRNWRSLFEDAKQTRPPGSGGRPHHHITDRHRHDVGQADIGAGAADAFGTQRPFGYDDGYDPALGSAAPRDQPPVSHEDITDEAAMALALDTQEYRPWVLQRGRSRPALMLHLRRYEPKSGLWTGWQLSYPHLVAVEYTGDSLLSLDFGTRQFIIEGTGLTELARHLQTGSVLMVQEFSAKIWQNLPHVRITTIRNVRDESISV